MAASSSTRKRQAAGISRSALSDVTNDPSKKLRTPSPTSTKPTTARSNPATPATPATPPTDSQSSKRVESGVTLAPSLPPIPRSASSLDVDGAAVAAGGRSGGGGGEGVGKRTRATWQISSEIGAALERQQSLPARYWRRCEGARLDSGARLGIGNKGEEMEGLHEGGVK
ncbi:hypothetical protein CLOM_g16814 [Closterium sp. NIES-68]|nr:hypothetical protein CLOM_g16814 [Closterium sp. NIES-68]GJP75610.1 hypothetical protein CLOP_g6039 [Closterium sp. NIES-67]